MSGVIQVPSPGRSPHACNTLSKSSLKETWKSPLRARRTVRGQEMARSSGKMARGSGDAHGTSPWRTGQGKMPALYASSTNAGVSERLTAITSSPRRGSGNLMATGGGSMGGYGITFSRCITEPMLNPHLKGLTCFRCGAAHDYRTLQTVCVRCGMPLRVDYALDPFVPGKVPSL